MKLDMKALAITGAILWGGCAFFMSVANLIWAGYGAQFLVWLASIYPGYQAARSFEGVLVVTVYAILDGFVGGAIFAWLYNRFLKAAA